MEKIKLNIQLFASKKSTTFSEANLSTQTNTSSLTITIYFTANNSTTWFSSEPLYCTCNGVTKSANVKHPKGGSVTKSFTFDNIPHDADGTKSVSWSWNCNTGTQGLGNISASGTRELTKIDRQSMFDKTGWDQTTPVLLTSPIEFTINQYLQNVYHKLTAYVMDSNEVLQTVATRENITILDNKYSFQFTNSELINNVYPLIVNSSTKYIRVYLSTYLDSELTEQIGTDDIIWYTGQVPSTIKPSVSIGTLTEADATMISLNWGVFVQNKSRVNIPITATGIYDSTIQSIVTTINGLNFTGATVVTPTLVTAGTNTITTTVTDSRGNTATTTKTYSVVPYSNPSITTAQVQRCLSDGTIDEDGTYVLFTFVGSISSASNNNSKVFKIGYKKTSDANYTYVTISSTYSVNENNSVSSFTISPDYAYDIIFQAEDSFMTTSISRELTVGFDLMNFNASGKAMAIGKVSEASANQELLEINLPTTFIKNIETADIDAGDVTCDSLSSTSLSGTTITGGSVSGTTGSFNNLAINNINILMPYTLYNNASGESGDVTLSDSAANYTYLEVFYWHSDDSTKMSHKIYSPNNSNFQAVGNYDNGTYLYVATAYYSISGTSISKTSETRWRIAAGGTNTTRTANTTNILIYRVVGYK